MLEQLSFLLQFGEYEPAEAQEKEPPFSLRDVEVLYIYKIGKGYGAIKEWLHEKKERRLVFLEDELGAIGSWMKSEEASEALADPQVHVSWIDRKKRLKDQLDLLAQTFPTERIEVTTAVPSARFRRLKLQLMRSSTFIHVLMAEALHSHLLLENLVSNFRQWPRAFFGNGLKGKFKGVPAVICGAGPSLQEELGELRQLEQRALVIGGGSGVAALSNQGITPHLAIAFDPNPEEGDRIRVASAFETPFLYGNRLQKDVLKCLNGTPGYLRTATGGQCELWMEKELGIEGETIGADLGREAFSVTTLAVSLAYEMGCDPIYLCGVDLSFREGKRYAEGVMADSSVDLKEERIVKTKSVHSLIKWVMEGECLSAFARAHPDRKFYNTSRQGLQMKGIALKALVAEAMDPKWDLHGKIHAEIEALKFRGITSEKIEQLMGILLKSLQKCLAIASEMKVAQGGKRALLEFDLQEEVAYLPLLSNLEPALERLLGGGDKWSQMEQFIRSLCGSLGRA